MADPYSDALLKRMVVGNRPATVPEPLDSFFPPKKSNLTSRQKKQAIANSLKPSDAAEQALLRRLIAADGAPAANGPQGLVNIPSGKVLPQPYFPAESAKAASPTYRNSVDRIKKTLPSTALVNGGGGGEPTRAMALASGLNTPYGWNNVPGGGVTPAERKSLLSGGFQMNPQEKATFDTLEQQNNQPGMQTLPDGPLVRSTRAQESRNSAAIAGLGLPARQLAIMGKTAEEIGTPATAALVAKSVAKPTKYTNDLPADRQQANDALYAKIFSNSGGAVGMYEPGSSNWRNTPEGRSSHLKHIQQTSSGMEGTDNQKLLGSQTGLSGSDKYKAGSGSPYAKDQRDLREQHIQQSQNRMSADQTNMNTFRDNKIASRQKAMMAGDIAMQQAHGASAAALAQAQHPQDPTLSVVGKWLQGLTPEQLNKVMIQHFGVDPATMGMGAPAAP